VVDLEGRAIGLNIARAGRTETYALPAATLLPLLPDLQSGKLAPPTATPPAAGNPPLAQTEPAPQAP
jgi:serine protease Do